MQPVRWGWGMATGLWTVFAVLGLASVWLALQPPVIALGLGSPGELVLFTATGLALAAGGSIALVAHPSERFWRLALAAGVVWFAGAWTSPGIGAEVLFTAGLLLAPATPAIVGHAMLGYAGPLSRPALATVVAGYAACVGLVGLAPVLAGAWAARCPACPVIQPGLSGAPELGEAAARAGFAVVAAWALVVVLLLGTRLRRASTPARRTLAPVLVPGAIAISAFGVEAAWSAPRGWTSVGAPDFVVWVIGAAALIAMSAGSVARVIRAARMRDTIAAMVLDLVTGTEAGRLEERLRTHLRDPTLLLAYPVGDGRLVAATGQAAGLATRPGRRATPLVRDGEVVAVVEHRAGLEEDMDRMAGLATAAGLPLENERLMAVSRSRFADVRASRARVVEATDRERARLERDLHDGAQQRLAGLVLAVRMARSSVQATGSRAEEPGEPSSPEARGAGSLLAEAEEQVRASIEDVREVAHGLYPAVLADLGLGAALESLAESASIPYRVDSVPAERLAPALESTAYLLAAQLPERLSASEARISATVEDRSLRLQVVLEGLRDDREGGIIELEDRVAALDGTMHIRRTAGSAQVEVDLPCGS